MSLTRLLLDPSEVTFTKAFCVGTFLSSPNMVRNARTFAPKHNSKHVENS